MNCSPRLLVSGALAFCVAAQSAAFADVKMPSIFGDHMVLQQDLTLPVWGTAAPGEAITVTVAGETAKTTAGPDGKWKVKLDPLDARKEPVMLTVTGKNKLTFQDVLIGEVWVCSGQSNMEFNLGQGRLILSGSQAAAKGIPDAWTASIAIPWFGGAHNADAEVPKADHPTLRLFMVKHKTALNPQDDCAGAWVVCTPETAARFSAVGYFFGRAIMEDRHTPVGLIGTYWGGTPAQSWTSLDGLKKEAALTYYARQWNQIDAGYQKAVADFPALSSAYDTAIKAWNAKYRKDFDAANAQWNRDAAKAKAANQPEPPRPVPPVAIPQKPQDPTGGPGSPATLFNGMIAPLEPYAIRGVIWYQGEANTYHTEEYHTLFSRMITDWRETWGEGDFPFLFVQLAGFGKDDVGWPNLREAQAQTLSLPKTGMATAVDIGLPDDIHPMDKLDVGKRLALAAMHVAYGQRLVCSGPVFQSVKRDGNVLDVTFKCVGRGLEVGKAPWIGPGAEALPMDHLVGFEVAGADRKWTPADAKIDADAVMVSSTAVPSPVEVRYDWKAYPEGNLYNKEGLPAPPFHGKVE